MIGENTVDELFEIKTFYGCHSLALIISSSLRELGFASIMIETADIDWAYTEKNDDFTHENLIFFSDNIYCFEDMFNTVSYTWEN